MKKCLAIFFGFLFIFTTNLWANEDPDFKLIQKNLEDLFAAADTNQFDKADSLFAPQVLAVHTDGMVRDKAGMVEEIKHLHMKSYKLTDFRFSRSDDVIIVTFKDQGIEKIDNENLVNKPALRLAVFQKQGDKWLIIAYANMAELTK